VVKPSSPFLSFIFFSFLFFSFLFFSSVFFSFCVSLAKPFFVFPSSFFLRARRQRARCGAGTAA
jgi:hypothetical protein